MKLKITTACLIMAGLFAAGPAFADLRPGTLIVAAISVEQAARMVQAREGGRVLGVETRSVGDRTVHIIKVLTPDGKRVRYVQVDAESGRISAR